MNPGNADYFNKKTFLNHILIRQALSNLNRHDEALKIYNLAIDFNSKNADYYNNKGVCNSYWLGETLTNLKKLNEAL